MKKILLGFIAGIAAFSCTTIFAEDILKIAENTFPILHWNSPTDIEAYNINDHTYLKLADVGRVFGVPVVFKDNKIHIGDSSKTNIAYYVPDYSLVPNMELCFEYPPSSILMEGDHSRVTYNYGLVNTKIEDSLAKFEEILQNDGFKKINNINTKLDFLSAPDGKNVVYNKSTIYLSFEDGGLDESSFQRVIIRMAHGDLIE